MCVFIVIFQVNFKRTHRFMCSLGPLSVIILPIARIHAVAFHQTQTKWITFGLWMQMFNAWSHYSFGAHLSILNEHEQKSQKESFIYWSWCSGFYYIAVKRRLLSVSANDTFSAEASQVEVILADVMACKCPR